MNKAKKIARQVNKLAKLDVFKNTRKREYIEARSLLSMVLYKYEKMNLHEIKNFYIANGKSSDHTTVLHSIKNWDMYRHYNNTLIDWLTCITTDMGKANNEAKRELIKLKVNYISNEDVDELAIMIDVMAKKELSEV
tara:strand:- start:748 stop:1158 length:411 start_codon:yes stop_codon:yes gene_type:complete